MIKMVLSVGPSALSHISQCFTHFCLPAGLSLELFDKNIGRGLLVPKMHNHIGVQIPSSQNTIGNEQLLCT